ncbi:MAG: biotin/lipoyl-binding protein, partial [Prevotella sp.]|nr:biotin/lipoyl-binding protein [Prevotella sp.]
MENKKQHNSVMMAVAAFVLVIIVIGAIGFFTIGHDDEVIQGQIEVEEYRVSTKVPSRILRICVSEGDYVKAGDTLVILDAPEVEAKAEQAQGAIDAAQAMSAMAQAGARKEQIQGAYELWQQAKAGQE